MRVAYNAEQSQIAIGNGGLTGTGLFQGTQTSSNLVPNSRPTSSSRWRGRSSVSWRCDPARAVRRGRRADLAGRCPGLDEFDRLMAVGVMSMFVFQVFQSAGMTMGMMPVTGLPMPFVSYGGSSMLTSMIAIGLILGVYRRRFDYVRA